MVLTRMAFQYPPRLNSYSLYENVKPGIPSGEGGRVPEIQILSAAKILTGR